MQNKFKVNIPLAILITLFSVLYQRSTGPTYPRKFTIKTEQGETKVKLLRSHVSDFDAPVQIPVLGKDPAGTLTYRRFPTNDEWHTVPLRVENNMLVGALPKQPPAGKHQYFLNVVFDGVNHQLGTAEDPITIRFKGDVPIYILGPHIFFMFFSMLIGLIAALEAFSKTQTYSRLSKVTLFCIVTGGMILGPIVQKFAFGVYWAGIPFGWDLTDNKLLLAVCGWIFAAIMNWKKAHRWSVMIAMGIQFATYLIPHSTMGSQLNYESGRVETLKEFKGP
ncbi:MAG: hypothetical protein Fur0010_16910 [Bdellovibrio sp.]